MSVSDILYNGVEPNAPSVEKVFHFLFYDPSFMILIEIEGEYHRVFKIEVSARFWTELEVIPVKKAIRYSSDNEIYAERIDYNWKIASGDELTLSIQRTLEEEKLNALFLVKSGQSKSNAAYR